jgi:hypothetical protein
MLTEIGLTPGGSSTVHIYIQTIHRKKQLILEVCGPCPVFANFTLAFALRCTLRNIPESEDLKFDIRQNFVHNAVCNMGCCNISAKSCGMCIHIAQFTPSAIKVTLEVET